MHSRVCVTGRGPRSLRSLQAVAPILHDRVLSASYDSLTTALICLHQPCMTTDVEWPVCQGCDVDDRDHSDAIWPCRSYTLIATTLLKIPNIEDYLSELRRELERAETDSRRLL